MRQRQARGRAHEALPLLSNLARQTANLFVLPLALVDDLSIFLQRSLATPFTLCTLEFSRTPDELPFVSRDSRLAILGLRLERIVVVPSIPIDHRVHKGARAKGHIAMVLYDACSHAFR